MGAERRRGPRPADLTGRRFGRLVALERVEPPPGRPPRAAYWRCRCDCGGEAVTTTNALRAARARSCGCLQDEARRRKALGMEGRTFGRLTVTGRAPSRENDGNAWWRCECSCGAVVEVRGVYLRRGETRSCGCWRADRAADLGRKSAGRPRGRKR